VANGQSLSSHVANIAAKRLRITGRSIVNQEAIVTRQRVTASTGRIITIDPAKAGRLSALAVATAPETHLNCRSNQGIP